ncbi:alpha-ketoglutarate-dependent dioxygenase alkB homolog 6 isoform X2 [Cherax quadricarinatus]|nr:alpha-ketoglutarate-dependent dioxygenase alkB homolog 6-like isoform X2 [Cherax quadricarinatus]XP_053630212.1 alpha-ketoglutarate-dependent dioxygenase alkB homolog 6-like isoform X2 [Cherax quadricarinatus]
MQQIYAAPKPKWKELAHRRLQNWGGLPHPKGMVEEPIPSWLQEQMDKITTLRAFEDKIPNHVLVNEYLPGQGIMPHVDGPMFYPTITTINIGSHSVLEFYTPLQLHEEMEQSRSLSMRNIGSLLLEPRSLLILKEDMYTSYLHGISQVTQDTVTQDMFNFEQCTPMLGDVLTRGKRISLTIRHVPKVLKAKLVFGRAR